jgi:hypothetical protein
MKSFEQAVKDYEWLLTRFIRAHKLPREWFEVPDHFAIKCRDPEDYEKEIELWRPCTQQGRINQINSNGRRLAAAELSKGSEINLGCFGKIGLLEIMEPRPERVGNDTIGVDHTEFYFPDFSAVTAHLEGKNIAYEIERNPGHNSVNVAMYKSGQEFKINDSLLATVLPQQLEEGIAVWV